MKTNIRLFVPNTTEALSFEYGLLIHYMTYNDAKSRSEISLDYYELSKIDPISNALDIVEQKQITDTTRQQSKLNGFTLSNHYTFSFDERYNNRIPAQNVRQVWLWLHCDEDQDYFFVVEKFTDTEQQIVSKNNQLFSRLWAHDDWIDRNSDPLSQQVVAGRTGLVTLLTQQLAVQFEQIEQDNRKKALAEIQAKQAPAPTPSTPLPSVEQQPINTAPSITPAPILTPASPSVTEQPLQSTPIVPPPIPVSLVPAPSTIQSNTTYPQLIPTTQPKTAKNKNWIWVVAAAVIAIPTLVMLNQETQSPSSVPTSRPAPDTAPQVEAALPAEVPQDDPIDQLSETATTIDLADQDKPPILVGLQWHSKTTDYRNPAGSYDDVVYQIMSNQDGIVLINKNITSRPNSEVILSYDDSLNLIGGKTGRYIPALANYEFPLTQGKTWDVTSEVIGNAYKDLQQASGQVIGPETISTPLGDFDTIKVVVTHTTYLAGAEVSRGQDISWYSPKIGRAVRTEETSWDTETQSWVLGRVHEITSVTFP